MKKFLALLLAVVMVLSLAACGSEAPAPAPTEAPAEQPAETPAEQPAEEPTAEPVEEYTGPDTYSMIEAFDITSLDYLFTNKSSNGDYTNNFIEGLLTQDPHGKLIAGMATEWSHIWYPATAGNRFGVRPAWHLAGYADRQPLLRQLRTL